MGRLGWGLSCTIDTSCDNATESRSVYYNTVQRMTAGQKTMVFTIFDPSINTLKLPSHHNRDWLGQTQNFIGNAPI